MVAAGCAIDADVLLDEVERLGLARERIIVDPRAVLVTESDRQAEGEIAGRIGSTSSGTGAALARRMGRTTDVRLAAHSTALQDRVQVACVAPLLHRRLEDGGDVIVEGTQGFGLSLIHGFDYPYVTSRDTSASAFASEVGISPRVIDAITLVVRTFPIRVGGESGPFRNRDEIDWQTVQAFSGAPTLAPEYTSVTRRIRRVARFDMDAVVAACRYNTPTTLAVMGLDRLDHRDTGVKEYLLLSDRSRRFVEALEAATSVPIDWVGTGFGTFDAFRTKNK
jgi:adenylosuccinate synthase